MAAMRIVMVTDALGGCYGQERVVAQSAALLTAAGHEVRFVTGELKSEIPPHSGVIELKGLFQKHWLQPRREIQPYVEALEVFLGDAKADIVHFIEVPDSRVTDWVVDHYPTITTAHLVSLTCPASHRLIRNDQICPEKSGWACLVHHHSYGCLSFLKSDLHRAHAISGYLRKRRALANVPVAAVSHYVERILIEDGWDESLIHYVPNPVSVPASVEPLADRPKDLVVVASRLVPLKGIDRLVQAFAAIANRAPHLWICGDGPERPRLQALANQLSLGDRVKFLGVQRHDQVLRFFASADIVVQPNLGPETFGMAAAEASALGRAVLASDVPALNEVLVNDESALLTEAGSVPAITAGLIRLLDSPELRQRLGAKGRARIAERYSPQTHLAAQLSAYRAAMASWRRN